MNYEKATCKILEQKNGLEGLYSHLMKIGTEFYGLSAGEMTPEQYTDMLIKDGRNDVLQHGTVYLYFKGNGEEKDDIYGVSLTLLLIQGSYHNTNYDTHETFFTTDFSIIVKFLKDEWKPFLERHIEEYDSRYWKRTTALVMCNLGVRAQLKSDRDVLFSELPVEERFKPGKITVIEPEYCKKKGLVHEQLTSALKYSETYYNYLITSGLSPEQASVVLPEATATTCIITTTDEHLEEITKSL